MMDPLTAVGLSIGAAILPTIFYVFVLVSLDRYEKEPWGLMAGVFLWGAIPAIVISLLLEMFLQVEVQAYLPGKESMMFNVAVVAPVVEELIKALPVLFVFWVYRKEFDGVMDGLLYGSLAGFGFAMTENVFYFLGAFKSGVDQGLMLVVLRGAVFGLNHALFCSMFGLGLGVARYSTSILTRLFAPLLGLAAGIALHMFHNFSVSTGGGICLFSFVSAWLGVGVWLALVYYALRKESSWIREQLAGEITDGLLTADEVAATANTKLRSALKFKALRLGRREYAGRLVHLYVLAAELAFRKRQGLIHGEDGSREEIERLRNEIKELKQTA